MPVEMGEEGHLAALTLNRPEKLNAFNAEMSLALIDALERADRSAQLEPSLYDLGAAALSGVVEEVAAELTGNRASRGNRPEESGDE